MPKHILVSAESCTGCTLCQLACSWAKEREFNPWKARIRLTRLDGQERYAISFSPQCDGCGFCTRYCFAGVLREVEDDGK